MLDRSIPMIKEDHVIHLLKAFPLLHFLRGDCVPKERTTLRPSAIKWTDLTGPLRGTEHMMYYKKELVFFLLCHPVQ